jgi:hypothetical protein
LLAPLRASATPAALQAAVYALKVDDVRDALVCVAGTAAAKEPGGKKELLKPALRAALLHALTAEMQAAPAGESGGTRR